ncbi:hypothetical protein NADFUDRAFT_50153 [Nadsonia fulvescens var. elongata DSM 6958]|uniref:Uncharacterized protein n=1 Tax=Nadsonia fulvescens var. elongata DSM 6958 TaxID=857566 RepID=A0A1E3PMR4_9ASCO|nr:hypothetical protein NADFUDRAFT_50153 [Nadsonia fulvescens var. elongata DSM 6958]
MTRSQDINDDFTFYNNRQRISSKPVDNQQQQPVVGEANDIAAVYQELNKGEKIATELEQMLDSLDQKMELIMQMAASNSTTDNTRESEDMELLQRNIEEKYEELSLALASDESAA